MPSSLRAMSMWNSSSFCTAWSMEVTRVEIDCSPTSTITASPSWTRPSVARPITKKSSADMASVRTASKRNSSLLRRQRLK